MCAALKALRLFPVFIAGCCVALLRFLHASVEICIHCEEESDFAHPVRSSIEKAAMMKQEVKSPTGRFI